MGGFLRLVKKYIKQHGILFIYQALYGDFKIYARPYNVFASEVDNEKYPDVKQKYRFARIKFSDNQKYEIIDV